MYNPGVTTTDPTQQRMVDDLQRNRVRYLILDARYADCYETSNLSREPGSDRLDRALGQDYRVVADYGAVVIMALPDEPFVIVAPGGTGPTRQHRPTTTPSPARGVRKSLERA